MPDTYSIGEVARRVGLSTSALRYYETLGLLPTPERSSGRRRYNQDTLDRLAMIDVAQRAGFSLREAKLLLDGLQADTPPTTEWRELATHKLNEIEQLLARTQAMRALLHTWLHCDCLTLDDINAFRQANTVWAYAQQADGQVVDPRSVTDLSAGPSHGESLGEAPQAARPATVASH